MKNIPFFLEKVALFQTSEDRLMIANRFDSKDSL